MVARQCEIKQREPRGDELKILAARPVLLPDTEYAVQIVVEAWFELAADRAIGFGGLGDIPTRAIRAWAKDQGFDRETRNFVVQVIRHIDVWRGQREADKRRLEGM